MLRGYGGRLNGPVLVNKSHRFTDVGDEAIIHSKYGTTCISKKKFNGGRFCEQKGSDLIILDDGLQNKELKKDLSILVVDSTQGVEAQTLANVYQAIDVDNEIVIALNKIDLPSSEPERVANQIEDVIGLEAGNAPHVSAKTGKGIDPVSYTHLTLPTKRIV